MSKFRYTLPNAWTLKKCMVLWSNMEMNLGKKSWKAKKWKMLTFIGTAPGEICQNNGLCTGVRSKLSNPTLSQVFYQLGCVSCLCCIGNRFSWIQPDEPLGAVHSLYRFLLQKGTPEPFSSSQIPVTTDGSILSWTQDVKTCPFLWFLADVKASTKSMHLLWPRP